MKFVVRYKNNGELVNVYDIDKGLNSMNHTVIKFLVFIDKKWQYVNVDNFEEFK